MVKKSQGWRGDSVLRSTCVVSRMREATPDQYVPVSLVLSEVVLAAGLVENRNQTTPLPPAPRSQRDCLTGTRQSVTKMADALFWIPRVLARML